MRWDLFFRERPYQGKTFLWLRQFERYQGINRVILSCKGSLITRSWLSVSVNPVKLTIVFKVFQKLSSLVYLFRICIGALTLNFRTLVDGRRSWRQTLALYPPAQTAPQTEDRLNLNLATLCSGIINSKIAGLRNIKTNFLLRWATIRSTQWQIKE